MQLISDWIATAPQADKVLGALRVLLEKLGTAGLDVRFVTGAYGCPLPSDIAYLSLRGTPPRRGMMAWVALLVAGETVERSALERGAPDGSELVNLLVESELAFGEDRLTLRACLQPLGLRVGQGQPWLLSDRLGAGGDAVSAPDLSAWNVIGCLPDALCGRSALDVGAGAGAITLHLLQAGAEVVATDVHPPALSLLAANLKLNGMTADCRVADVFKGVPARRYDLVVFNAPLLRSSTLGGDGVTWYTSAEQGEAVALRFAEELDKYIGHNGEALLHSQWTPALAQALRDWRVTSALFATAADGTPFGLHRITRGEPQQRALRTPLGTGLPHLRREIFMATTPERDALLVPAPWLELVVRRTLASGAEVQRSFGGIAIDEGTEACLLEFAQNPRRSETALDFSLVDRGWLVDQRGAK